MKVCVTKVAERVGTSYCLQKLVEGRMMMRIGKGIVLAQAWSTPTVENYFT